MNDEMTQQTSARVGKKKVEREPKKIFSLTDREVTLPICCSEVSAIKPPKIKL